MTESTDYGKIREAEEYLRRAAPTWDGADDEVFVGVQREQWPVRVSVTVTHEGRFRIDRHRYWDGDWRLAYPTPAEYKRSTWWRSQSDARTAIRIASSLFAREVKREASSTRGVR